MLHAIFLCILICFFVGIWNAVMRIFFGVGWLVVKGLKYGIPIFILLALIAKACGY